MPDADPATLTSNPCPARTPGTPRATGTPARGFIRPAADPIANPRSGRSRPCHARHPPGRPQDPTPRPNPKTQPGPDCPDARRRLARLSDASTRPAGPPGLTRGGPAGDAAEMPSNRPRQQQPRTRSVCRPMNIGHVLAEAGRECIALCHRTVNNAHRFCRSVHGTEQPTTRILPKPPQQAGRRVTFVTRTSDYASTRSERFARLVTVPFPVHRLSQSIHIGFPGVRPPVWNQWSFPPGGRCLRRPDRVHLVQNRV